MRIATIVAVLIATAAHAITQAQIDAAAPRAHNGLRSVVRKLAGKGLAGRDNDTPGSLGAPAYLIRKLRRLGGGLTGGGTADAAYKQAFVNAGQTGTNLLAVMPGSDLAASPRSASRTTTATSSPLSRRRRKGLCSLLCPAPFGPFLPGICV
jgi:hypothetical protein